MRLFGGKSCKQQDEHATNEASQLQRQGPLSLSTCLGMEKLRTRTSSVSSHRLASHSQPPVGKVKRRESERRDYDTLSRTTMIMGTMLPTQQCR